MQEHIINNSNQRFLFLNNKKNKNKTSKIRMNDEIIYDSVHAPFTRSWEWEQLCCYHTE